MGRSPEGRFRGGRPSGRWCVKRGPTGSAQASSRDSHGALCRALRRDRRLAGTEQRVRGGRRGADRARGQGGERAGSAGALLPPGRGAGGPHRTGSRAFVAVAARRAERSRLGGGVAGDSARESGALGDDGQDRPQGRPRHRPVAAYGPVPPGAPQIARRPGCTAARAFPVPGAAQRRAVPVVLSPGRRARGAPARLAGRAAARAFRGLQGRHARRLLRHALPRPRPAGGVGGHAGRAARGPGGLRGHQARLGRGRGLPRGSGWRARPAARARADRARGLRRHRGRPRARTAARRPAGAATRDDPTGAGGTVPMPRQ